MNEFMDSGHKLEVGLKDGIRPCIPSLRKCVDGIEERVQDVVNANTLEITSCVFVAVEHLPVALAQHVVVPMYVNTRWTAMQGNLHPALWLVNNRQSKKIACKVPNKVQLGFFERLSRVHLVTLWVIVMASEIGKAESSHGQRLPR